MSKHTPGPWRVFNKKLIVQDMSKQVRKGLFHIAKCEYESDAHLIAAAPELLQLAYAFHTYLKDCPDDSMESLVKKTIAKAEGRE